MINHNLTPMMKISVEFLFNANFLSMFHSQLHRHKTQKILDYLFSIITFEIRKNILKHTHFAEK